MDKKNKDFLRGETKSSSKEEGILLEGNILTLPKDLANKLEKLLEIEKKKGKIPPNTSFEEYMNILLDIYLSAVEEKEEATPPV